MSELEPRCAPYPLCSYVDGELNEAEVAELQEHLHDCPECADLLQAQQLIKTLLRRSCREQPAPPTLRERVWSSIMAQCQDTTGQMDVTGQMQVNRSETSITSDGSGIVVRRTWSSTVVRRAILAPRRDDDSTQT